jgi:zinc transporter ZupT
VALLLMPYSGLHLTFSVAPSVFVLVTASPRVFQFLMVFFNGAILFILLVSALPEQTATDGVIIDQYSDDTNG